MEKSIVLDMDGSIADLYVVDKWLEKIHKEDESLYLDAEPMMNVAEFNSLLNQLKEIGYRIVVTSWLAKGSSKEYDKKVRKAKKEWIKKYNIPIDEIHLIKYGTTKANATRKQGGYQILFDDNEKIRKGWKLGKAVDPININEKLKSLLLTE